MKQLFSVCLAIALGTSAAHAGPTEAAILAAMRLSDQPNYSWVATVSDDARTYDIEGKTTKGGFTYVKMPVINSVRRRMGRSVTDTQIGLIFKGNVACVIETDDGWMKPDELPPPEERESDSSLLPLTGHGPLTGKRPTSGGMPGGGSILGSGGPARPQEKERGYSNLQLAISHPHEELAVIVGSHAEFKAEGDVISGTLTDLGAQLLLVRDGQNEITPVRAAGTFKLWVREGSVTKYQVRLEGILTVDTPRGRRNIAVNQTTNTLLSKIGTTTFDVPAEARAKLAR